MFSSSSNGLIGSANIQANPFVYSGYQSNRTGRDTSLHEMWATNGLVTYDHTTNTATNITDPNDIHGYAHGAVRYLGPYEDHPGLLLILPSRIFQPSENFTEGIKGGQSVREIGTILSHQTLESNSVSSTTLLKLNSSTLRRVNFIHKQQAGMIMRSHYPGPDSVQYWFMKKGRKERTCGSMAVRIQLNPVKLMNLAICGCLQCPHLCEYSSDCITYRF